MRKEPDPIYQRYQIMIGSAVLSMLVQLAVVYFMGLHKDFPYIFVLVIVINLFGIVMLIYRMRSEVGRTDALKKISRRLGLNFKLSSEGDFLEGFLLYKGGPVRNLMTGSLGSTDVSIFGYTYMADTGGESSTVSTTVMLLDDHHLDLPHFFCRPETFWERNLFKPEEDIDFPEEPAFSDDYYLTGEDQERIRSLFQHEVAQFFVERAEKEQLTVEGRGRKLVIYQQGIRTEADQIRSLLDEGRELVEVFRTAGKRLHRVY